MGDVIEQDKVVVVFGANQAIANDMMKRMIEMIPASATFRIRPSCIDMNNNLILFKPYSYMYSPSFKYGYREKLKEFVDNSVITQQLEEYLRELKLELGWKIQD